MLLGVAVGVLLVLPGEEGWYPGGEDPVPDRAMVHGWPLTFLWRIPKSWAEFFDGDKTPYVWHLLKSIRSFRPALLAVDIIVVAASVALIAWLFEWRQRIRRKRHQFSLRSMFVATALFAGFLAWWTFERRADDEFVANLLAVQTAPLSFLPAAKYREPRFPLWARAIVGDERLNELRITRLSYGLDVIWTPATHEHVKYLVSRFPEHVEVELKKTPDGVDLTRFIELTKLQILFIHHAPSDIVCRLSTLPALRRLHIGAHHDHALDDAGMICLAKMPSLRVLDIIDGHRITEKSLVQLAKTSRLQFLSLWRSKLTRDGMSHLAGMLELRELDLTAVRAKDADLEPLANSRIERLILSSSFIKDDGLKTLGLMPALKRLVLHGELVSDAAVAEFKKHRPDVEFHCDHDEWSANDKMDLRNDIDEVIEGKSTHLAVIGTTVCDADLIALGKLIKIDSLALNARHLTDVAVAQVESLTLLKELDVSGSQITTSGMRRLNKLPRLRTLTFDEAQVTDQMIDVLKQMRCAEARLGKART